VTLLGVSDEPGGFAAYATACGAVHRVRPRTWAKNRRNSNETEKRYFAKLGLNRIFAKLSGLI
jgi:hypothetical protein